VSYVRNAWYVAAWSRDITTDKPYGMTVLDEPIVVWRDDAGNVHVFEDRCVHRLAPLSLGRCEGANLRCMYHGFLFGPDGQVVSIPGQAEIPAIARVRSYPAIEQDSWIWVWMGKAELADPNLIPRVKGLDEQDWLPGYGVLDYEAEARLINDNLTDLSHLPFVHGASFAATDEFAASLPTVTPIENGVRIQRWAERQPPLGLPDAAERFDAFLTYDYLVPGIFSLWARQFPVGTFERLGGAVPPDDLESRNMWSSQAVTPIGKGKARYFFSQGPGTPIPQEFSDFLWQVALNAFAEDRAMIEGQQRIIDLDPDRRIMPAVGDKGTVLYTRLVERMIRVEREVEGA
jgi:phenylpropionate dioxygenase-like ring-hydroxylating dioxygenase large terminal subunit